MTISNNVQFIPASGEPEWAVIPYAEYLQLKSRIAQSITSKLGGGAILPEPLQQRLKAGESPIKLWREFRGISQSSLAQSAEISIPYLSQLEHQIRSGSKKVLKRIAKALEVDVDRII